MCGLVLRSKVSGELRTVQPHRTAQAGTMMAPFANRIKDGSYSFQGTAHALNDGSTHAMHGLLKEELPCTASSTSPHSASITLTATFDGSDPGYASKREQYGGKAAVGGARDRDSGELRFSLRSLAPFLPVRTKPPWFCRERLWT